MSMVRVIVHDHEDAYVCEIEPSQVLELATVEEVNGEHSLNIVTTQELEKTNRLIVRDGRGYWHEYVVLGIMSEHSEGGAVVHDYYCVWSLQYDLSATFIDNQFGCGVVPGHASVPQTATKGLQCALEGTTRWTIGTVSVTAEASASFYRRSGWEGLQTVVEKWGGELHATITVSTTGVVGRAVDLLAHEGVATAVRRFDYGYDVTGIRRTISDEIWPCRIVPLGASQETENGGYTRRPSIESVNGGVMWLQDDAMVPYTRVPDGNGGWEYPTLIVTNDTYEEPADLKAWALDVLTDYTKPIVSYEADVAQFVQAGMDAHGVSLGDEVVVVDRTFGSDGLQISARVVKVEQSLLDPADVKLTIGNAIETLSDQFAAIARGVEGVAEDVASAWQYQGSSTEWVSNLLSRINAEANATGGYTYITEGQGIRCYDVAVTDPLVGAEASAVCEVKGGTMRIANTKDAGGNWEWKTVFTSGRILAELIDAIGASSGYHAQLTPTGLDIYDGADLLAHFGAEITLKGDYFHLMASELYRGGSAVIQSPKAIIVGAGDRDPSSGTSLGYNPSIELITPSVPGGTTTLSLIGDNATVFVGTWYFDSTYGSGYFTTGEVVKALTNAGMSDSWTTVSASDWISLGSGWSIQDSTLKYNALRKRVVGYLNVRCTAAKSSGNNSLGTVSSDYSPPARVIINTTTNGAYKIYVDGSGSATMVLGSGAAANTDFYLAMDYQVV